MHADPPTGKVTGHKPNHLAERFEGMIGVIMVVAVVILAVGLIYGILTGGNPDPKWMQ